MKKQAIVSGLFAITLLAGAGCGSSGSSGGSGAKATAKVGVAAPNNEKELVDLVPALKQCKFEETFGVGGYDKCPAYKDIKEKAPKLPNGLATMINFFEDPEPVVRYAAAHTVSTSFYSSNPAFADEASANRVWAAINKESFLITQKSMTSALAKYGTKVPSAAEKAAILIKSKAYKPALRSDYLYYYQVGELMDNKSVFNAVVAVAEDETEDVEVRKAAIRQFSFASSGLKPQIKPVAEKLSKSPNADVAAKAKKLLEELSK